MIVTLIFYNEYYPEDKCEATLRENSDVQRLFFDYETHFGKMPKSVA
jgi:hypothetical protein